MIYETPATLIHAIQFAVVPKIRRRNRVALQYSLKSINVYFSVSIKECVEMEETNLIIASNEVILLQMVGKVAEDESDDVPRQVGVSMAVHAVERWVRYEEVHNSSIQKAPTVSV